MARSLKLQTVLRTAKAAMLATGPVMQDVAQNVQATPMQLAELNDAIRDLADAREALETCRKVLEDGGVSSDARRELALLGSMQVRS